MFEIVSWTKTQKLMYIFLNLNGTVADDFQNNFDQATINSFVNHLADTFSGTEYLLKGKKGNQYSLFRKNSIKKFKGS